MNFHLVFIIITYLFSVTIIHLLIKNNNHFNQNNFGRSLSSHGTAGGTTEDDEGKLVNNDSLIIDDSEIMKMNEEENNDLVKINDFDEKNARNELLDYLDGEKNSVVKERKNLLGGNNDDKIKGSNFYSEKSQNEFDKNEMVNTSNHFIKNNKEAMSINTNQVPTQISTKNKQNNGSDIINKFPLDHSSQKIFDNVEPFDDFDGSYAKL